MGVVESVAAPPRPSADLAGRATRFSARRPHRAARACSTCSIEGVESFEHLVVLSVQVAEMVGAIGFGHRRRRARTWQAMWTSLEPWQESAEAGGRNKPLNGPQRLA